VQAQSGNGAARDIASGATVLATGGFQGNPGMLRTHLGEGAESLQPISPGSAFNQGEGIRMALEAGAQASGVEPEDARRTTR